MSTPHDGTVVGVDRGGTWIRIHALRADGRSLRALRSESPSLDDLPAYLKRTLRKWQLRPRALIIASRGIWTPAERRLLKTRCRTLAPTVSAISDVEAAWLAAFDDPVDRSAKPEGILVISGTGSIAYGQDARGRIFRAGGLGPLFGDEGSAFWIGREWIKRLKLSPPRGCTPTMVAAYAAQTFSAAKRGHRGALAILREAQNHLATLARELSGHFKHRRPIPLSWTGSVLSDPTFRKGFLKQAMKKNGRFVAVAADVDPATAAARSAL